MPINPLPFSPSLLRKEARMGACWENQVQRETSHNIVSAGIPRSNGTTSTRMNVDADGGEDQGGKRSQGMRKSQRKRVISLVADCMAGAKPRCNNLSFVVPMGSRHGRSRSRKLFSARLKRGPQRRQQATTSKHTLYYFLLCFFCTKTRNAFVSKVTKTLHLDGRTAGATTNGS